MIIDGLLSMNGGAIPLSRVPTKKVRLSVRHHKFHEKITKLNNPLGGDIFHSKFSQTKHFQIGRHMLMA